MKKSLEKIGEKLWIFLFRILNNFMGIVKKDHVRLTLRMVCKAVQNDRFHVAFHMMPKEAVKSLEMYEEYKKINFAIVIQGPIYAEDNFTLNTVKFYKAMYPNAKILVSTWDDEKEEVLELLRESGAIIVKSKKPDYSGNLNVNYQLVSARAGLLKARELGCEYLIKTRTDQRICKDYVFYSIISMLDRFPCSENQNQKSRIFILAVNYGNMFTPYFMSDFLYAGRSEDVINVFSIPLDEREQFQIDYNASRREQSRSMHPPEIYIMKHYLKDILGRECEDTVEQYWKAIKECFICMSMKDVGLLWPKYDIKYELNFFYGDYFSGENIPTNSEMGFDFINWFNLYCGVLKYKKEYEKFADERLKL